MNFHEPVVLGRTGLKAGRLGIASGSTTPTSSSWATSPAVRRDLFAFLTSIRGREYPSFVREGLVSELKKEVRPWAEKKEIPIPT